jgi:hypothetical protein
VGFPNLPADHFTVTDRDERFEVLLDSNVKVWPSAPGA